MAAVTFLEPGTDATQGFEFWQANNQVGTGTVTSDTAHVHTGTRAIKSNITAADATSVAYVASPDGVCADAGTRISLWVYFSTVSPSSQSQVFGCETAGDGTVTWNVGLNTTGKLVLHGGTGVTQSAGATVLSANTWYRLTLSFVVTSTTVYTCKLFINGVLEATITSGAGTLPNIGSSDLMVGMQAGPLATNGAIMSMWFDDIYVDNGTTIDDPGAIQVTAKRPFANGTTNGFTGSGTPSGYGTGNARYVNEQPLNTANVVSVVGAGSAVTEEYNIESLSAGDVNLTGATLFGVRGWLYTKALAGETGKIVVDGTQTNITITTSNALFTQNSATPTAYPAGTGTDIGEVTATSLTTVTLYECGILVAYIAAAAGSAPFYTVDLSPVRSVTRSIDIRTWSANLLETALATAGTKPFPTVDLFQPPLPGRSWDLRTWTGNTLQNTLAPILPVPFNQTAWPLPLAPQFWDALRTDLDPLKLALQGQDRLFGAAGQVPTFDWPLPKGPVYVQALRNFLHATDTNLAGQDRFFGAAGEVPAFDWVTPAPVRRSIDLSTWLINPLETTLNPTFTQPPFVPLDFPNPRSAVYASDLRSFLGWIVIDDNAPFAQTDWPLPRTASPHGMALRTWTVSPAAQLVPPFALFDWPLPKGRAYPNDARTWLVELQQGTLTPIVPTPFALRDWPVPTGAIYVRDLRTFTARFPLELLSKDSFFGAPGEVWPLDWPNPRGPIYAVQLRTFIGGQWLALPLPLAEDQRRTWYGRVGRRGQLPTVNW